MSGLSVAANGISDRECLRVATRLGTPLFYYSLSTLRGQINRLRQAFAGYPTRLLFATMANDRAEILRTIAAEGVGACVNSIPHLQRAVKHGFPATNIQFTSCGLPSDDMAYLQALGVPANLDSPSQIGAWCGLKRGALVGARINAASLNASPAPPDRIGMDENDFVQAREIARGLGGRVNGVHIYAGTNFQSPRDILPILKAMFELVRRYPDIDYLNIGGGVGVDYSHEAEPFDYEGYGRDICDMASQVSSQRGRPLVLLFEPGRSLVASSGVFVTRVTDVKTLRDTRFVVVDASIAVFPRPFHHPGSWHKTRLLGAPAPNGQDPVMSTVVGRTTFSRDILGSYELPAGIEIGTLMAFEDAGAYCESMMSRFLGQREPTCYISED
jgi:diaminopimelate decarboxylase